MATIWDVNANMQGFHSFPLGLSSEESTESQAVTRKNMFPCANCSSSQERCVIDGKYSPELCQKCWKEGRRACPPHMPRVDAITWKAADRATRQRHVCPSICRSPEEVLSAHPEQYSSVQTVPVLGVESQLRNHSWYIPQEDRVVFSSIAGLAPPGPPLEYFSSQTGGPPSSHHYCNPAGPVIHDLVADADGIGVLAFNIRDTSQCNIADLNSADVWVPDRFSHASPESGGLNEGEPIFYQEFGQSDLFDAVTAAQFWEPIRYH
ncbi:hypothetical protein BD410DRAFT_837037 [Rickenella mellea]|uniref:Uncharacterized protein n=1 Tax=Rickenella mellea TaxID=50990 RepID=A0A4Y7QCW9_9AGAM|nr:hypothetical protein BD410DRAFT_837037 [Rickenella mellea]